MVLAFAVTGGMPSPASAAVGKTPADECDALAALALEYRTRSVRFITARLAVVPEAGPPEVRPAAAGIVLWFHSRIYFTTMRALVGKAVSAAGRPDRREDACVCAGETLVAVDRSRAALQQLPDGDDERRALVALLDAIARGIEERFPRPAQQKSRVSRIHPRETIFRGTP